MTISKMERTKLLMSLKMLKGQSREGEPLVEVTEVGQEGPDRRVLVRSRGCREKERAIHDRFLSRLSEGLERLAKGIA